MESFENTIKINDKDKRIGNNFLGILNDLKRRPEDASRELGVSVEIIDGIISGEIKLSTEIVKQAIKIWPVNERDFYIITDDCATGVKIMRSEKSEKSSRIMKRAGKPYYEYRDTVASTLAPFRPEWIMELCYVKDNDQNNSEILAQLLSKYIADTMKDIYGTIDKKTGLVQKSKADVARELIEKYSNK